MNAVGTLEYNQQDTSAQMDTYRGLDAESLFDVTPSLTIVGGVLFLLGVAISGIAAWQLDLHRSTGLRSDVYTGGSLVFG